MRAAEDIQSRLLKLYPDADPTALRDIAPLLVEFGCEDLIEYRELVATVYEWRAVLATLGPGGMTLQGMLGYEWHELPGVQLCRRVHDSVRWGPDGVPYLDGADSAPPLTGFRPLPPAMPGEEPRVWLREQGGFAVVDGVALKVD